MIKILLSYRRADSAAAARLICDHLSSRYGAGSVFMDIDAIPFGTDFRAAVRDFIREADTLLVLIGPSWRGERETGLPRITDKDDPVRVEVELALESEIPIVPILVGGAMMPPAHQLPESIGLLSYLNAAVVDVGRDFNVHLTRVIDHVDRILVGKGKKPAVESKIAGTSESSRARIALVTLTIAACLSLPFASQWARISPPWPRGIAPMTTVILIAAIAFSFQMLKSSLPNVVHRVWLLSSSALGILLAAYLALVSHFTYEIPGTNHVMVKGFVCTSEALLVHRDKCPYLGLDELKGIEYEAEQLWTSQSITIVRLGLVMSWLMGFVALGTLVGALPRNSV